MGNVMGWIKEFFLNSTLVVTSCIVGLVLFEIFLEFENKYKPVERIFIDIHGQTYAFLKSESTVSPLQISSSSAELLVLGDSFTEGVVCAHDNANFPSYLNDMMGSQIKVVNLGVGGKNNADYVDFLDYFSISPGDVALVTLYDNDTQISQENCNQIIRQAKRYNLYVPNFC